VSIVQRTDHGRSGDDGSTQMTGRSSSLFGGRARRDPVRAADRVKRLPTRSSPTAAGGAGTRIGSASMGGRTPARDLRSDGMINESDRGGAHDY
jgi:hypothetical protein